MTDIRATQVWQDFCEECFGGIEPSQTDPNLSADFRRYRQFQAWPADSQNELYSRVDEYCLEANLDSSAAMLAVLRATF